MKLCANFWNFFYQHVKYLSRSFEFVFQHFFLAVLFLSKYVQLCVDSVYLELFTHTKVHVELRFMLSRRRSSSSPAAIVAHSSHRIQVEFSNFSNLGLLFRLCVSSDRNGNDERSLFDTFKRNCFWQDVGVWQRSTNSNSRANDSNCLRARHTKK